MAVGVYFQDYWQPLPDNPTSDRVHDFLEEESRFQFVYFFESEGELDSIYLISYEPITSRLGAVNIPPDAQISSQFRGEFAPIKDLYEEFEPEDVRNDLESSLDLDIEFWVSLRKDRLARLIDLLGGANVPVGTTQVAQRDTGDTVDTGDTAGGRWMDGNLAVRYMTDAFQEHGQQGLRYRHKTLFEGLLHRLGEEQALLDDRRFQSDVQALINGSNVNARESRTLVTELQELSGEDIRFLTARERSGLDTENRLDSRQVKQMLPQPMQEIIESSEPQERIQVQLLNGAGTSGLADAARERLQSLPNVDVVEVGNADRFTYETTRIIDRSGNPQSAKRLQEILERGEIEQESSDRLMVDATVILGKDAEDLIEDEDL